MSYIYLGSPYSDERTAVQRTRYLQAAEVTAKLLMKGIHVYSPIVHCHELAVRFTLPGDFAFWKKYNLAMLSKASGLAILELPGWETSRGLSEEIRYANSNSIPLQRIEYPLKIK